MSGFFDREPQTRPLTHGEISVRFNKLWSDLVSIWTFLSWGWQGLPKSEMEGVLPALAQSTSKQDLGTLEKELRAASRPLSQDPLLLTCQLLPFQKELHQDLPGNLLATDPGSSTSCQDPHGEGKATSEHMAEPSMPSG